MDISTLKEVESLGGRFYDQGQEKDVFDILQSYDVNAVRLRLWNNPYKHPLPAWFPAFPSYIDKLPLPALPDSSPAMPSEYLSGMERWKIWQIT